MIGGLPALPITFAFETEPVFRQLIASHRALPELKGSSGLVPNRAILINTLSLQEARDSSAIENIVTTQDELFASDAEAQDFKTQAAKVVFSYARALREGSETVERTGLLTTNVILSIQATREDNSAGFRRLPGTALRNEQTGEIVFTPPQSPDDIVALMGTLERYRFRLLGPETRFRVLNQQTRA